MTVLLNDLVIGESPRWHEDRLWFCHWGAHEIIAVDLDGNSEIVIRDPEISPHSICLDAEGAVWTSIGGNDCVRVREGGEVLQRIELDRSPFACMLGGPDGRTLFVKAARWNPADPFGGPRTGQVLAYPAPAPRAGHP